MASRICHGLFFCSGIFGILDLGEGVTMKKLTLSEKITRLKSRLHDREWRRYGTLLLIGKGAGIAIILTIALFRSPGLFGLASHAQDAAAAAGPKASDIVNPLNTVWTLLAAFLVFGMQVGFTMLEAGFCRSRETVNALVEGVFDTCLCGFLFYAWGYAFMFGAGNGLIGWHDPTDTADVHK